MSNTEKLNPEALAEMDDSDLDARDGVQPVTEAMIRAYVMEAHGLPNVSAYPFAAWLQNAWFDFIDPDSPETTNGQIVYGAVQHWIGK
jgi:hypothetical protein